MNQDLIEEFKIPQHYINSEKALAYAEYKSIATVQNYIIKLEKE